MIGKQGGENFIVSERMRGRGSVHSMKKSLSIV